MRMQPEQFEWEEGVPERWFIGGVPQTLCSIWALGDFFPDPWCNPLVHLESLGACLA